VYTYRGALGAQGRHRCPLLWRAKTLLLAPVHQSVRTAHLNCGYCRMNSRDLLEDFSSKGLQNMYLLEARPRQQRCLITHGSAARAGSLKQSQQA